MLLWIRRIRKTLMWTVKEVVKVEKVERTERENGEKGARAQEFVFSLRTRDHVIMVRTVVFSMEGHRLRNKWTGAEIDRYILHHQPRSPHMGKKKANGSRPQILCLR